MAAIMNSKLHSVEVNGLFHKLNLQEMESTLGGNSVIPLWDGNYEDLYFSLFPNERNNSTSTYPSSFSFYNNKLFAIDFSNLNIYLIV